MTMLVRRDPFRGLIEFQDRFDRLFDRRFASGRPWQLLRLDIGGEVLPIDVYETDDDVVVKASLPGVKAENVEVTVNDGTLTIKGDSPNDEQDEGANYYRHERRHGTLQRSVLLPAEVNADEAEAVYEAGVLSLRLPKVAAARAKTIPVQSKE